MSGRKLPYDPIKWKVQVHPHLAARVELRLTDPARGKPMYGVRSQLIAVLLQDWLNSSPEEQSATIERAVESENQEEILQHE